MQCARHPKVETGLTCSKCGTPICPRCGVQGPVGMRCRDCASLRSSPLYQVRPERLALAAVLGIATGTIAGFLLQALSGLIYFALFVSAAVGGAVGDVILRAAGNKRGLKLEILAGVSILLGAALSQLISGTWRYLTHSPVSLTLFLVAVGLTASAAIGRIRFL